MTTRSTIHRTLQLALALAAAGALTATPARAWYDAQNITWADGQLVDVQLRVAGQAAPLFLSPEGANRKYFEAFAGRNYSVVLRNNTGSRVGVLIAVDGLNVVNGEKSRLAGTEPMYVLDAYETATIDGWRTSLDDIRRFVFVDEKRSYASRTGQANGDMGWIRVQAYREQRAFWQPRSSRWIEDSRRDAPRAERSREGVDEPMAAAPAPTVQGETKSLPGRAKAQSLNSSESDQMSERSGGSFPGTGWGDHRSDPVQRVEFTAERRATDQLSFRYEYASGLRALGIFPGRDRLRERDNGELGFAKPPRW